MKYLFPFDKISFGEKIIIYGYGKVGKSYIEQINMTNYCHIVAIADRMAKFFDVPGYRVIDHQAIINEEFDKIVIALGNEGLADSACRGLIDNGIKCDKIIVSNRKLPETDGGSAYVVNSGLEDGVIHICVEGDRGLGDDIVTLPILHRIKELLADKVEITYISKYRNIFEYVYCVDVSNSSCCENKFDLFMKNCHVPLIVYWNPQKLEKIAPLLHSYILSVISFRQRYYGVIDGDKLWHLARVINKKRYNICDFEDKLGVLEPNNELISVPKNENEILKKFGLIKGKYIVVNRDVDINSNLNNFKLWPIENYNILLEMLRKRFDFKTVRLGARDNKDIILTVDKDLAGQTRLNELLVILKNAIMLISSEGGLVHLNHFIGGISAVVYGPTDEKYFGYEGDIICVNRLPCRLPCQFISEDENCPLKSGIPQCMLNVTPQMVYQKILPFLVNR